MIQPMLGASELRIALRVAAKELKAAYRDKQMVATAVLLPMAMYPVMFWAAIQAGLVVQGAKENQSVETGVAVAAVDDAEAVRLFEERLGADLPGSEISWIRSAENEEVARRWSEEEGREDSPDAVLWIPKAPGEVALFHDSTRSTSVVALERLEDHLGGVTSSRRKSAAEALQRTEDDLVPLALVEHNLAAEKDMGAYLLSMILPMMLVIMTVLGAFFPAVDMTAGEKERGTQETTLLLPVPRSAVHLGKILAVTVSALIACFLNLLALGLSAGHILSQLGSGKAASFQVELPWQAFLTVAPLAALFALFVSAVMVATASLTKTFKEGQALLGPVQMVFFVPAFASAIPALTLDMRTAFIPVVNVTLAFRQILRGDITPLPLITTAIVLIVVALAATGLSLRLLSREALFVSGQSFNFAKLAKLWRSEKGAQ